MFSLKKKLTLDNFKEIRQLTNQIEKANKTLLSKYGSAWSFALYWDIEKQYQMIEKRENKLRGK